MGAADGDPGQAKSWDKRLLHSSQREVGLGRNCSRRFAPLAFDGQWSLETLR